MISMACLIFFGHVPDDYSVLHNGGAVLLWSRGAPEHESSFYFVPISTFSQKDSTDSINQLVRFKPTVISYKLWSEANTSKQLHCWYQGGLIWLVFGDPV